MTVTSSPWSSTTPGAANHLLIQLTLPVISALANGDLETANALSTPGLTLTPYLIGERWVPVWKRRSAQIKADERDAVWTTRAIIDSSTGAVFGVAGFHGQPDERGMVEVGYLTDPLERRKGHARAALRIMIDVARKEPAVKVVRATVPILWPENWVSRKLVEGEGFVEVGEEWDEEDGLKVVFEFDGFRLEDQGRSGLQS